MTDEEKKIIKTMLEMGYDRTNIPKSDVDKVIYKGLRALDENVKLKEAVGKIKDEIKEKQGWADSWNMGAATSLKDAIKIIDKHTEGLI